MVKMMYVIMTLFDSKAQSKCIIWYTLMSIFTFACFAGILLFGALPVSSDKAVKMKEAGVYKGVVEEIVNVNDDVQSVRLTVESPDKDYTYENVPMKLDITYVEGSLVNLYANTEEGVVREFKLCEDVEQAIHIADNRNNSFVVCVIMLVLAVVSYIMLRRNYNKCLKYTHEDILNQLRDYEITDDKRKKLEIKLKSLEEYLPREMKF